MAYFSLIWDLDDDPEGNVQHIAEHDLTKEEVEDVLLNSDNLETESDSSGRPIVFGDPLMIRVVTAYDVEE